jgi:SAM-dependent methyltransferase
VLDLHRGPSTLLGLAVEIRTRVSNEMSSEPRFDFGKNWERFVAVRLCQERVRMSKECLLAFLGAPDLKGKIFLDIGCGSGLSSLAAFEAGASRIISFDYDPHSVEATRRVRAMRNNPENWTVTQGSVLDAGFMESLDKADVVYSWGVLHHTGGMWRALELAAGRMKDEGVMFIALYTTDGMTEHWKRVKHRHVHSGQMRRRWIEWNYAARVLTLALFFQRKMPWTVIREYSSGRGMDFMVDVRDWVGGYPFETATPQEVVRFGREKLGVALSNIKTGEACTEYLFVNPRRFGGKA